MSIEINVPTAALRSILEADPEVNLKLQSMATEKIAEELLRKSRNLSLSQFQSSMQATIDKAMAETNMKLTNQYKFPDEAKVIIQKFAREYVEQHFNTEKNRIMSDITSFFAAKQLESDRLTEEKVRATIEQMRPAIRQQAREEFVTVLETAKGVMA